MAANSCRLASELMVVVLGDHCDGAEGSLQAMSQMLLCGRQMRLVSGATIVAVRHERTESIWSFDAGEDHLWNTLDSPVVEHYRVVDCTSPNFFKSKQVKDGTGSLN